MNPVIRITLWTAAAIGNLVLASLAGNYFGEKIAGAIMDFFES